MIKYVLILSAVNLILQILIFFCIWKNAQMWWKSCRVVLDWVKDVNERVRMLELLDLNERVRRLERPEETEIGSNNEE